MKDPKAFVSDNTKRVWRYISLSRRKKLLICCFTLLIVAAAGAYYYFSYRPNHSGPTVVVNGKKYPAQDINIRFQKDTKLPTKADYEADIKKLETKIASGHYTYMDYLTLAQLYLNVGSKDKAIENYQKAKEKADSSMPYYQSFITDIDNTIKHLKESK